MNLILFSADEIGKGVLAGDDPRTIHLLRVLRRRPGDSFDMALTDGPLGKGRIMEAGPEGLRLEFDLGKTVEALPPITLAVATPRPQTARKILQEATALGVANLRFFRSDKAEPSYQESRLWTTGEYRRHLVAGAEQAFSSRLPSLLFGLGLDAVLEEFSGETRVALDNYEATHPLADAVPRKPPVVLLVGAERGWSAPERESLRKAGCLIAHLGTRVLRTETASVAALSVLKTRLNLW